MNRDRQSETHRARDTSNERKQESEQERQTYISIDRVRKRVSWIESKRAREKKKREERR